MEKVTMTCMTTKQKFEVDDPTVVVLANGRFAYRVKCPWEGKNGKELYAFKFCSAEAHAKYKSSQLEVETPDSPRTPQKESPEAPESPTIPEKESPEAPESPE
jgi:hypothetical protein